jgi:ribonuclease BN (tRNA processing enzyme)
VRGSTPAPGGEFVRYGGHTSCLALAHDGSTEPTLVLDAGTGLRRVTAMLHDAQHTAEELARWAHYGHSAADYAVALGAAAGARHVLLFHHGPSRTDDDIEALLQRVQTGAPPGLRVDAAAEGTDLHLWGGGSGGPSA